MVKQLFFTIIGSLLPFINGISQENIQNQYFKEFFPKSVHRFDALNRIHPDGQNQLNLDWKITKTQTDHLGVHHDRYQAYYKGIKIIGGNSIVHSKGDFAEKMTGNFTLDISNVDENSAISGKSAEQIAARMMQNLLVERKIISDSIVIHPITKSKEFCIISSNFPETTGKLVLAYEIELAYQIWQTPYRMKHFINAKTGEPIVSIDEIVNHNVPGRGKTNYYGEVSFDHDSIGPGEFHLRDLSRGEGVFIRNSKTNTGYVNTSNHWLYENSNDKAAIDVIYGTQLFYDLLYNRFQYNSLDNQGTKLIGFVNNSLLSNAYWDGAAATFGGGDCHNYNSFTTLEVVGHEFAHGITDYSSNLIYMGESGAINESFSDIMGKALEYYTYPNQFSWLIGKKVVRLGTSPFRSMSNPNSTEQPAYYKGMYWTDFIYGVHTNSGVMNYWFYLLVKGGQGTNEKNVAFDVKSMGMDKAVELVFLLNTSYLTETTTYPELYEYSKLLTESIYGLESEEYKSVLEAWKAVGLPEVITENYSLTMYGLFNGSEELNPYTCWQEPNLLNFAFVNNSHVTIPKDATIRFQVYAQYNYNGVDVNDTIFNDVVLLSDSIQKNERIELPLEFSISPAVNYVGFTSQIQVIYPGTNYVKKFLCAVKFNHQETDPQKYFKGQFINTSITNRCDHSSGIERVDVYVDHTLCEGGEYIFEFEFDDNQQKISYFDTIQFVVNRSPFGIRPSIQNPNVSTFNRTSDVTVRSYAWVQGLRYFLMADTLSKYFPTHITVNDTINFQHITDYRQEDKLIIYPCFHCTTKLTDQTLVLNNPWSNDDVNDCFSEKDFYTSIFDDPFVRLDMSQITGCFHTEDMIDPHLSFDVQLGTTWTSGKPQYRHGLFLYENLDLKTDPVINYTGQNLVTYTFPIQSLETNTIDLSLYLDGASATLDNIYIFDKFYSQVHHEPDINPFTVTNPNLSLIEITWNNKNERPKFIAWFDQYGNKMTEHTGDITNIDCSSWPPGIYFYHTDIQNKNYRGKVVVVK